MEGLATLRVRSNAPRVRTMYTGWTIWGGYGTLPSNPASRSIGSLASCSAMSVGSGDLDDEQQLNQSFEPAWFQAFGPSCDAFASDWSIPPLDRIGFLPTIRPRFKSNVRLAYPIGFIQHCNVWRTDFLCKTLWRARPVRQQVSR